VDPSRSEKQERTEAREAANKKAEQVIEAAREFNDRREKKKSHLGPPSSSEFLSSR